jgi:transposase
VHLVGLPIEYIYYKDIRKHEHQTLMLLQRNNATTHTNAPTSASIQNIRSEVVPYPPYSVVLAPSDFWLSAVVRKYPKGIHFTWDEEAHGAIGKWFRE